MNEENVAIRLKGFIDYLGISSSQFADQCGIPRPTLSQLLNGRNKKISDVLVGQIHTAYPELNVVWLLFGEGDMLNRPSRDDSDVAKDPDDEFPSDDGKMALNEGVGSLSGGGANNIRAASSGSLGPPLEQSLVERDALIEELRKEIDRLKRNPRKVAQITVYYDDSTFETFYPGNGGVKGR